MSELSKEKFQIIGCDNLDSEGILRPSMTYWQDAWRRLKKNKVAMVSLVLLGLIVLMTIIGPLIGKFEYQATNNDMLNLKPNSTYWFGTDSLGRDLFSRVWIGGRISIAIGIIGAIVDTVVGTIYGGIAGYLGGIADDIMMRILEILVSIPYLFLVILIRVLMDQGGMTPRIIAMTITGWC